MVIYLDTYIVHSIFLIFIVQNVINVNISLMTVYQDFFYLNVNITLIFKTYDHSWNYKKFQNI